MQPPWTLCYDMRAGYGMGVAPPVGYGTHGMRCRGLMGSTWDGVTRVAPSAPLYSPYDGLDGTYVLLICARSLNKECRDGSTSD
eukprot:2327829-Pyramimonas_sp.AAC.1